MKFFALLFLGSLIFGTVTGFSPVLGVSVYIHDIALLFLFAAGFIKLTLKKKFIKPKLLTPILVFAGVAGVSLMVNAFRVSSPQLVQSSLYLLRWMMYVGIYIIAVQSFVPIAVWLWGLAAVGGVFAALGILQYALYPSLRNLSYLGWDPHYYRLFSTLLDPNFAGILLVLSILLSIYLWKRFQKNWIIVPIILEVIALYLTYSRSSYLALIASIGYVVFRISKGKLRGIIAILLFIFLVVVLPKPGGDTLRLDRMVSTIARVENWQESIKRIGESPILGFGFNTLRFVFPSNAGEVDLLSKASAGVDSSLLFVLLTTGIVGFVAYVWLVIKQIKLIREPIFLASIIAVLVHSMFVNSLFYPWIMIWMWVLIGIVERINSLGA